MNFHMSKPKRRSNSTSFAAGHNVLKSKFEAEDEQVIEYDESIHGPDDHDLEKMSTRSSLGSAEEEENGAKETTT